MKVEGCVKLWLMMLLKMNWRSSTRIVSLLYDSNCHPAGVVLYADLRMTVFAHPITAWLIVPVTHFSMSAQMGRMYLHTGRFDWSSSIWILRGCTEWKSEAYLRKLGGCSLTRMSEQLLPHRFLNLGGCRYLQWTTSPQTSFYMGLCSADIRPQVSQAKW
jgi:hypothetical protein